MRAVIPVPASRAVLALLAVVMSAGCATKGDLRNVRTEIRALNTRTDSLLLELQRQRRLTVDTLGRQTRQLSDLQGNVSQQLRDIADALDELRELAGQNSRDIAAIRDQMVAGRRPSAVGLGPGPTGGGGDRPTAAAADTLFQASRDLMFRNSFAAARRGFNQFLDQYPRHELAPKAHYHLADILVQEGRLEEAIDKFLVIRELFPEDPAVPDALYRVALLHIDRDEDDEARRYLRLIIDSYAESAMVDLARDKLAELGG